MSNKGINVLVIEQDGQKFAVPLSAKISNNDHCTGGPIEWDNVQNKPTEFPPSAHGHICDDITDLELRLAEIVCDGEITVTGKSAYESWLELPGNEGKTVAEFIEALKGKNGDPGPPGKNGDPGPTGNCTCDLTDYVTKNYVDDKIAGIGPGGGNVRIGKIVSVQNEIVTVSPFDSDGNPTEEAIVCNKMFTNNPVVGDTVMVVAHESQCYALILQRHDGTILIPPGGDNGDENDDLPRFVSVAINFGISRFSTVFKCRDSRRRRIVDGGK